MTARLKFTDFDRQVKTQILFALAEEVDKVIRKNAPKIQKKAKLIVSQAIKDSPVMDDLIGGKLMIDFGLTTELATAAAREISDHIVNNVSIQYSPFKKNTDLIASFNTGKNNGEIHWLEWLLTRGTEIIIGDFRVMYKEGGRSGGGIMISSAGDFDNGFRVDPEHAGTEDDNFITRAIDSVIPDLQDIITRSIQGTI
jgi:hypothetical protein